MKKFLTLCAVILTLLIPGMQAFAAVTFLEPGGDADFGTSLWSLANTGAGNFDSVVSDIVHGGHQRSLKITPSIAKAESSPDGVVSAAGGRISMWIYISALPSSDTFFLGILNAGASAIVFDSLITSTGILRLKNVSGVQLGADGPTLSTGQWYRISLAFTLTSTTVNRFELNVFDSTGTNNIGGISVTNGTLTRTDASTIQIGPFNATKTLNARVSDIYTDTDSSLTDPGNIWVTAKRPVANGTTNGFTTQVGSSGSGYGTGHSPQVNERPLSATNGWSMVGAGSAVTEEYSIEGASVGDIDLTNATIVDSMGWVNAKSLSSETGQIIVGGKTSSISLTSTAATFIKMVGSSTYPAGGTDVGIVTSTTLTTVSLFEAGIVTAYIPGSAPPSVISAPHMFHFFSGLKFIFQKGSFFFQ